MASRITSLQEVVERMGVEVDEVDFVRPIRAEDVMLISPPIKQRNGVQRTVCLNMPSAARANHGKTLAQHFTAVSMGKLKLQHKVGVRDGDHRVVAVCDVPQGGCLIESEAALEDRPITTGKFAHDGDTSALAALTVVLTTMGYKRASQWTGDVALTPLIQDLITPNNILIGFRCMTPALRGLTMSIFPPVLFHLLCTIMSLRQSMHVIEDPTVLAKRMGKSHSEGKSDEEMELRHRLSSLFETYCENNATFPSTHGFRTACCTTSDWKRTSGVNAISIPYIDNTNTPRNAVVALRAIRAGEEVCLPNPPLVAGPCERLNTFHLGRCACKECTSSDKARHRLMSRKDQHATYATFTAFGLWAFLFGSPSGRTLVKTRIVDSFPMLHPLLSDIREDCSPWLREPQAFLLWRALSVTMRSTKRLAWSTRAEKDILQELVPSIPVSDRMEFVTVDRVGPTEQTKPIVTVTPQQCREEFTAEAALKKFTEMSKGKMSSMRSHRGRNMYELWLFSSCF